MFTDFKLFFLSWLIDEHETLKENIRYKVIYTTLKKIMSHSIVLTWMTSEAV